MKTLNANLSSRNDGNIAYRIMKEIVDNNEEEANQAFFENFDAAEFIQVNKLENISVEEVQEAFEKLQAELS